MREMKSRVVNADAKLRLKGKVWSVVTCLFADDTVLLAESEGGLQRVVNEFYSVYKRRKLTVNAGKSKVMVLERRKVEVVDFNTAYRVRLPAVARCRVMEEPEPPRIEPENRRIALLATRAYKR